MICSRQSQSLFGSHGIIISISIIFHISVSISMSISMSIGLHHRSCLVGDWLGEYGIVRPGQM